jgi:hypothetical protein
MNRLISRRAVVRNLIWILPAALASPAAFGQSGGDAIQAPIRFGDIVLSRYLRGEVRIGKYASVTGPNSTVDATDPKTGAKGRLQASKLVAYMAARPATPQPGAPRTRDIVERIEAETDVHFVGTRPAADGKGIVNVRVSGSRLVYHKLKGLMEFSGPVKFFADEPSPESADRESVDGVADRATYDEAKRIVVLTGNVSATVMTPDTAGEGSKFTGDQVTIDMSEPTYVITINNESLRGSVKIPLKERPAEPTKTKK